MIEHKLFEPYKLGDLLLKNRMAMAPLTRCRAKDNIPNSLMAEYYAQRANAGLLIAEGTSPSPNGLGYTNIPGSYSEAQMQGWAQVCKAVKENQGHIFLQMMHTGRVGHTDNLPEGGELIAPSAVANPNMISTYNLGRVPYPVPRALTTEEVKTTIDEFTFSAEKSIEAGFDGIEIHCAHGYLPNQFLNPETNLREDNYGGSIQKRCRFVLEVMEEMIAKIGKNKTAIRISPFSYFEKNMHPSEIKETYKYLLTAFNKLEPVYVHLSFMGENEDAIYDLWKDIRKWYSGTIIVCGSYTTEKAILAIDNNIADMVAFGRDYIHNPDLEYRLQNNIPLNEGDKSTYYGLGPEGYTDYPFAEKV